MASAAVIGCSPGTPPPAPPRRGEGPGVGSARRSRGRGGEIAYVEDFAAIYWADVGPFKCEDGHGDAAGGNEFHLERLLVLVAMDDRPHVAPLKAMLGKVVGQDDQIKFADHW